MANIFRSKEVYKKVNKNESSYDRDVLIPVGEPAKPNSEYGVYVAGEYRPPYYTDGLTILGFSSEHVHVVDYTTDYKNTAKEPTTIAFGFSSPPCTFVKIRYTEESYTVSPTPTTVVFGFSSPPCTFDAYRYGRDYKNVSPTPTTIAFGFSSPPLSFSFKRNVTDELINQPEPGIQLESITSDPAVITNVV